MPSRPQRRKEKQKQKRKAKKEQQRKRQETRFQQERLPPVVDSPHMRRLAQQQPQAWAGERSEDVAVFEDTVLETLPPDLVDQVTAIRESLQLACDSRGQEALERVAGIARTSPLSQWRLFLRGLVAWIAEDPDTASEAWKRLDFQRRPGRMAVALMNARRGDLSDASAPHTHSESPPAGADAWSDHLDDQLRYHAKLLRRVRFDRSVLKIAEAGVETREISRKLLVGPNVIRWLKQFVAEHRSLEPSLTAKLQQVALDRAMAQPYVDVFDMATKVFEGPRHDRRNLLRSFFYFARFEEEPMVVRAEQALKKYLEDDLPNNEELSEPLRAAIASQIHLQEALTEISPPRDIFSFSAPREDAKAIRRLLNASIDAFPENRAAYKTYLDWIESKLEDDRLTKSKREPLLKDQASVMGKWSRALPDDAQPRLWLVDYLLEREQTEEAKPHVDWLAASRQDDPRVRAAPWKWYLLEAMRLCRRKAWLADVPSRLDEAELRWPAWLSRQWLPYLRAAWALRAGNTGDFELQRQELLQSSGLKRDCLSDACMMLAAAQHMRVPASDLKVLRAPVDGALKRLREISDDDLLAVGVFFWDLHRTKLLYPAYRMHGKKFTNELFARLKRNRQSDDERLRDTSLHAAMFLCSEHRCFDDGYNLNMPSWYSSPVVQQHPMFAAAKLNVVLKLRYPRQAKNHLEIGSQLRQAAQSERDPFYRYWFAEMADAIEELVAQQSARNSIFNFNPLDFMFDEDDDEDQLGFDPDCNCPNCRAARENAAASRE